MTPPRSPRWPSRKDGGFLVLPDFFTIANRAHLLAAIAEARLPAVFWSRSFVDEGGLMSYSTDSAEQLRRAASYIDRILKGAQAADLPVQNPTKFELVINLKTARAIGVTIPAEPARNRDTTLSNSVSQILTFAARSAPARFQGQSANT